MFVCSTLDKPDSRSLITRTLKWHVTLKHTDNTTMTADIQHHFHDVTESANADLPEINRQICIDERESIEQTCAAACRRGRADPLWVRQLHTAVCWCCLQPRAVSAQLYHRNAWHRLDEAGPTALHPASPTQLSTFISCHFFNQPSFHDSSWYYM